METLISFNQENGGLVDNQVFVNADKSELKDGAKVVFLGKNNILQVEDEVCLRSSSIKFRGDNKGVYLDKIDMEELDIALKTAANAGERIEKVHRLLAENHVKNRFEIDNKEHREKRRWRDRLWTYWKCMTSPSAT